MRRVSAILWLVLISAAIAAPGNAANTSLTQAGGSTGAFTLTGSVTDATTSPDRKSVV